MFYVEKNLKSLVNKHGTCRFFPPVAVYIPQIKSLSYELPVVRGNFDWCAQYEPHGIDDGDDECDE